MRYLPFISSFAFLLACGSPYKNLHKTTGDTRCLEQFKPTFSSALYKTEVEVTGKHIGGLLLIKTLADSSIRMVFSNQLGFKFFDFGFSRDSGFQVHYIMKQMDKKAVLITLRKDFELVLMQDITSKRAYVLRDEQHNYYAFPQEKGINYYITDSSCSQLLLMQRASKRKAVVEVIMKDYDHGMPDTIGISHKNFNFTISLKKISK
jgi:hypothetical protein